VFRRRTFPALAISITATAAAWLVGVATETAMNPLALAVVAIALASGVAALAFSLREVADVSRGVQRMTRYPDQLGDYLSAFRAQRSASTRSLHASTPARPARTWTTASRPR
jgi:hypothetical protein